MEVEMLVSIVTTNLLVCVFVSVYLLSECWLCPWVVKFAWLINQSIVSGLVFFLNQEAVSGFGN